MTAALEYAWVELAKNFNLQGRGLAHVSIQSGHRTACSPDKGITLGWRWTGGDSDPRPLPCQGSILPLNYQPSVRASLGIGIYFLRSLWNDAVVNASPGEIAVRPNHGAILFVCDRYGSPIKLGFVRPTELPLHRLRVEGLPVEAQVTSPGFVYSRIDVILQRRI